MTNFKQKPLIKLIQIYFDKVDLNPEKNGELFIGKLNNFIENVNKSTFLNLLFATRSIDIEELSNLKSLVQGYYAIEDSNENFKAYKEVRKTSEPAKEGEIISWCDELLIVSEVYNRSCTVHSLDGQLYSNNFYFGYENTDHYVVGFDSSKINVEDDLIFEDKTSKIDFENEIYALINSDIFNDFFENHVDKVE